MCYGLFGPANHLCHLWKLQDLFNSKLKCVAEAGQVKALKYLYCGGNVCPILCSGSHDTLQWQLQSFRKHASFNQMVLQLELVRDIVDSDGRVRLLHSKCPHVHGDGVALDSMEPLQEPPFPHVIEIRHVVGEDGLMVCGVYRGSKTQTT